MTQVISVPIRREIIKRHQRGETLPEIAQTLSLSFWGVRRIWRQYQAEGEAGLTLHYDQSGRHGHRCQHLIYRSALWLKRRHPSWGGGLIQVILKQRYPTQTVPHRRTLQRWFRQHQLNPAPPKRPIVERHRAEEVHQIWQLDATSHVHLADRTPASWITLSDEYSGAILQSVAFPPLCF